MRHSRWRCLRRRRPLSRRRSRSRSPSLRVYLYISAQSGQRPRLGQKQPASRKANNKSQAWTVGQSIGIIEVIVCKLCFFFSINVCLTVLFTLLCIDFICNRFCASILWNQQKIWVLRYYLSQVLGAYTHILIVNKYSITNKYRNNR